MLDASGKDDGSPVVAGPVQDRLDHLQQRLFLDQFGLQFAGGEVGFVAFLADAHVRQVQILDSHKLLANGDQPTAIHASGNPHVVNALAKDDAKGRLVGAVRRGGHAEDVQIRIAFPVPVNDFLIAGGGRVVGLVDDDKVERMPLELAERVVRAHCLDAADQHQAALPQGLRIHLFQPVFNRRQVAEFRGQLVLRLLDQFAAMGQDQDIATRPLCRDPREHNRLAAAGEQNDKVRQHLARLGRAHGVLYFHLVWSQGTHHLALCRSLLLVQISFVSQPTAFCRVRSTHNGQRFSSPLSFTTVLPLHLGQT